MTEPRVSDSVTQGLSSRLNKRSLSTEHALTAGRECVTPSDTKPAQEVAMVFIRVSFDDFIKFNESVFVNP